MSSCTKEPFIALCNLSILGVEKFILSLSIKIICGDAGCSIEKWRDSLLKNRC